MIGTYRAPIDFTDLSEERVAVMLMWEGQDKGSTGFVVEVHLDFNGPRQVHRAVAVTKEAAIDAGLAFGQGHGVTATILLPHHRALPRRCSA